MPRSAVHGSPANRAARRWLRRFAHYAWRVVRVLLVASAAMGPNAPPPPPPPPAPIEARAEPRDRPDDARR